MMEDISEKGAWGRKEERELDAAKRMLSDDGGFARRVKDSIKSLLSVLAPSGRQPAERTSPLTSRIESEYGKYAEPEEEAIPQETESAPTKSRRAIIGKDIELIDDYGNRTRLYKH